MKKALILLICVAVALSCVAGCAKTEAPAEATTQSFTDSLGRVVELPATITKIAPSGAVATMLLATIAPDSMVCVSSAPSENQMKYLPANLASLPETGQLYGSKSTINLEALIATEAQVIIDLGDKKDDMAADLDALEEQTGMPVVFIEADLDSMAEAYRSLGKLLGCDQRGEELASFIDKTLKTAADGSAKVTEKLSVMYGSGVTGLDTNANGSIQAQVLDLVGADNAVVVEDVSNKGGGNTISMEQLYNFDPDVILLTSDGPFDTLADDETWANLTAVQNGRYYVIPDSPYNWLSNPPSLNMALGIWWLGNLLYPEFYDYDMAATAQEFYKLFWGYELKADEVNAMLANSTLK